MIINFKNQCAQDVYDGANSRYARQLPKTLHDKARRLFDQLNAVTQVESLKVPPGNQLEKLKGNLKDYWSIRINKQWRIIFRWEAGHAYDVEIIDYH
jgi:proteic killer suppression protein